MNFFRSGATALAFVFSFSSVQSAKADESLALTRPEILISLEEKGLSFSERALFLEERVSDNSKLIQNKSYRALVDSTSEDLQSAKRSDPKLSPSMNTSHRLFDARWLSSKYSYFELVGVINRIDRTPFKPNTCGEIRLIYRLAYKKGEGKNQIYSRLPMTVNVVYWAADSKGNRTDCTQVMKAWKDLPSSILSMKSHLSKINLKSVETNLQAIRWPSTVRPDFGGYAEYFLRVFQLQNDRLVPNILENTPDVQRLQTESPFRNKLLKWLKLPKTLKEIDAGVVQIPDEFLTKKATSIALHGNNRISNMPFSQVFKESDFADVDFKNHHYVRSPLGILRRLDDMSCIGCHQGRTVAGFHFLGVDRPETIDVNAIHVPASPHFFLDQNRRKAFMRALEAGAQPNHARPFSIRADQGEGGFGSHCGLESDPTYSNWKCQTGLTCKKISADESLNRTGICQPNQPTAGSACQSGKMIQNKHPHRDRIIQLRPLECSADQFCEDVSVGFPNGMCSGSCTDLKKDEKCGSIAVLAPFNSCLAARKPFSSCLKENVRPGALRECSETAFCRDDYICARTAERVGTCIPPYFLFQLRVDGHPAP